MNGYRGILQSLVVPVADAEYGSRPAAFLKMEMGMQRQLEKADLLKYLREKLPGFKIPVIFHGWPAGIENKGLKVKRGTYGEMLKEVSAKSIF